MKLWCQRLPHGSSDRWRQPLPGQNSSGGVDLFLRKYDGTGAEVWTRQFGSSDHDGNISLALDASGSILVAGTVGGPLPGQHATGSSDAFLRKYDTSGTELWTRQFGASYVTYGQAVAVDATGCSYIVGRTGGTLPGQTNAGDDDAFLRKYDASGTELWTRQFGSPAADVAGSVAADHLGNVYVAVSSWGDLATTDAQEHEACYLRKYDSAGVEQWTHQLGSRSMYPDACVALGVDREGFLYVGGSTWETLPGNTHLGMSDGYLRKLDGAGVELWAREFGTADSDGVRALALDGKGDVYATGWNNGYSVFLTKYSSTGQSQWGRELNTLGNWTATSVAVRGDGTAIGVTIQATSIGQVLYLKGQPN